MCLTFKLLLNHRRSSVCVRLCSGDTSRVAPNTAWGGEWWPRKASKSFELGFKGRAGVQQVCGWNKYMGAQFPLNNKHINNLKLIQYCKSIIQQFKTGVLKVQQVPGIFLNTYRHYLNQSEPIDEKLL